ncbi:MAG: hypothetical protein WD512_05540 [Candidatus Paceibacterota bacterium]
MKKQIVVLMKNKSYLLIGILFLITILLYHYAQNAKENNYDRYDLGNPYFTVGEIEEYFQRGTIGSNVGSSSITYTYEVSGRVFRKNYDKMYYKLPEKPKKHQKYIVLYNKDYPENSILLGDYKFRNESDTIYFSSMLKDGKIKF